MAVNSHILIVPEHHQDDGETDLGTSLAFTVENQGQVDVTLYFNGNPVPVVVLAGMHREFEFLGVHYFGPLVLQFDAEGTGRKLVLVLKRTLVCPN